eukprot:11376141-Karenia_brevis.AAC.1
MGVKVWAAGFSCEKCVDTVGFSCDKCVDTVGTSCDKFVDTYDCPGMGVRVWADVGHGGM